MLLKIKKTWLPVLWELNTLGTTEALTALRGLEKLGLVTWDHDPIEKRYFGSLTVLGKAVLDIINKGRIHELNQAKACRKYVTLEIQTSS